MPDPKRPGRRPLTENRLLSLIDASGDTFWELDLNRRYVYSSEGLARMMGYTSAEVLGTSVIDHMTPEYKAEIARLAAGRGAVVLTETVEAQPLRHEGELVRKDGCRIWAESVSVPVFDESGQHIGYFGITRETTQRKHAEQALHEANQKLQEQVRQISELHQQLREQAIRDDLTGLHNRRHFVEYAEREMARAKRLKQPTSLVMIDVDHFKAVNDRHGHLCGDEALRVVGALLTDSIRSEDMACRLGGEEFAVLLPSLSYEGALARAELWRSRLSDMTIAAPGVEIRLTASFGVATHTDQVGGFLELLRVADERLYRAKAEGRNRVV